MTICVSLREAISNANAEADTTQGDCAPGTGNDTIVFNLSGTIALASGLPSVQHTLEIDGTGQTITIDGGGANSVLLNSSGALTLNNLTIANGETTGNGGGIFNAGPLTVTNSTFLGNSAAAGGAIFNSGSGTLAVTNCTFSGNSGAGGGAIHSDHGGTVTSSTFSNNSAGVSGAGAAILANNTTVEVTNSILSNSTGLNCGVQSGGVIGNGGYNISDDTSCGFGSSLGANGDTIGDDVNPLPATGGLQNNGGPTDTIALQPNSPAVNAVPIADCPPTDQRGDPRPDPGDMSNACDIGAFESIDALGTPTASATPTVTATSTGTAAASPTATPTATATVTSTATATAT
ncbi:choice-of-anchor Q domain-containing protein, partial [Candidatus Binatus sp.]